MKACNVANLLAVVGCVTLTSNGYAQAIDAMAIASTPAVTSGKATTADRKRARDVRKALSNAPTFNVSNVFVKARAWESEMKKWFAALLVIFAASSNAVGDSSMSETVEGVAAMSQVGGFVVLRSADYKCRYYGGLQQTARAAWYGRAHRCTDPRRKSL
ncbi:hypothetical protein B0G81_0012 [Paraburkholderia sp. BL6665CI2N2]|nr:hypothetical protein B0G81_0012 [Paraburkholderia sp. BL6665CI2N2]